MAGARALGSVAASMAARATVVQVVSKVAMSAAWAMAMSAAWAMVVAATAKAVAAATAKAVAAATTKAVAAAMGLSCLSWMVAMVMAVAVQLR